MRAQNEKGTVLIVNGFDRVSAPESFASRDSTYAGFLDFRDSGVPYKEDISYIAPFPGWMTTRPDSAHPTAIMRRRW